MRKPKPAIRIKVFNTPPWQPAFGWYTVGTVRRTKAAQIDVNVLALLNAHKGGAIPKKELPYFLSRVVMHEVVHALEDWARVEFNHHKIGALLRVLNTQPGRAHGKGRR